MWKWGRTLAVCALAAAWWGIFYPELCFSRDTCAVVQQQGGSAQDREKESESRRPERSQGQRLNGAGSAPEQANHKRDSVQKKAQNKQSNMREETQADIDAADILRASGDEIVIGSRFLEWCREVSSGGADAAYALRSP